MDTVDNAITKPVRRLEVFTGTGRRRSFSDEAKARIVAEIVTSGDSVSGVARRHGLSPQQLRTPHLKTGRPRYAILLAALPATASYRASGLVLWHLADVGDEGSDVRYRRNNGRR
jgi:lambda repressor-like predicted transcriptional regulator